MPQLFIFHLSGHSCLLLKLDKQISGTIYWPILAANEA